jgi:hypothetical protein
MINSKINLAFSGMFFAIFQLTPNNILPKSETNADSEKKRQSKGKQPIKKIIFSN